MTNSLSGATNAPLQLRPVKGKERAFKELPDKPITKRQKEFVDNLEKGMPATTAALSAGYSPLVAESASSTILKSSGVLKELARRGVKYLEESGARDPEFAISRIAVLANANLADYGYVKEEEGTGKKKFVIDLSKCSRDQMYCIEEISSDALGNQKIRLASRSKNLETLLKLYIIQQGKDKTPGGPLTIQALDDLVQKVTNIQVNNYNYITSDPACDSADRSPVSVGDSRQNLLPAYSDGESEE